MNDLSEAEKLYLIEGDLEGLTGWADEDDEEGKVSSAEARELIKKIFKIGSERVAELERHLKPHNDGNFYIPNCSTGQYADFYQQANLNHFKEKYPWLHEFSQQIGLDPDQAGRIDGDFERLLAKVPAMDWEQFLEDVDYIKHNYEIDDEGGRELEMKEESRWMKEDGVGELRTALLEKAGDSFSAFVFSWVNESVIWDACRFSSLYPDSDGQGSVWMDMDTFAKDEEVREFILEEMKPERFRARWEKIKRLTFETRGVGVAFTEAFKKHILHDVEAARLYDNMSAGEFYKFFQKAIPDTAYRDDARAYWYQFHTYHYGTGRIDRKWTIGRMHEYDPYHKMTGATKNESTVMEDALNNLMALPATMALFKRVGHREPEDHPELPLESLREALGVKRSTPGKASEWIPSGYQIDDEFNCLTNSENLASLNPKLRLVQGWARFAGSREEWGAHQWCEAPDGSIVDPYYAWEFPGREIEYVADAAAFDNGSPPSRGRIKEALGDEDEPNPEQSEQPELIPFDPAENEGKPPTAEDEIDAPDVDYIKTRGHLRVDRIYADQHIDVVQARDADTLRALLKNFSSPFHARGDLERIFVVRRVRTFDALFVLIEYPYELQYWEGKTWHTFTSKSVSQLPEGKSIKKWLEARYTDLAQYNAEKVPILFQIGGVRAIARLEKLMGVRYSEFDTVMGITAGLQGKLKAAVDYFQSNAKNEIDPQYTDADRKGIWVHFHDWGSFTEMFSNPEAAGLALEGENYDWFEWLWESKPSVESVMPYLTKEAIGHIRYLLLGREVWLPEAGENRQGDYGRLTKQFLDSVDDKTMLSWIEEPSDEDKEIGAFDDIREAIQNGGVRMLEMAGRDQVTQRYEKEIVDSTDATKHEWQGEALAFYMQWGALHEKMQAYEEENNSVDVSLHDLIIFRTSKLEPRVDDLPDWPDVKGPYAQAYCEEACTDLMELQRQEPPEDKNQLPLLPEALDDEAPTKFDFINNVPVAAEREVKRAIETVCRANNCELVEFSAKMHPATDRFPFIDFDFRINPPLPKDAEVDLYWIVRKTGTNALAQNGLIQQAEFVHQWKPEVGLLGVRFYVYRVNEPNWQPPTRLEYLERNESIVSNESPAGIGA